MLMLLFLENSLIHPAPKYPRGDWEPDHLQYEDVYFTSADGTRLHGWYVPHPTPRAHVIYFHGNAQNVASLAPLLNRMNYEYRISIFAVDWRGYGRSEGAAHEAGVLADSQAAAEWLSQREGIPASQIVQHGRSLGGAAAVHLAAKYQSRGLIVEDSFSSMPDVAAPLYPWLPVRWLMRSRYDSAAKIGDYEGPFLQAHGGQDQLIPPLVAMRLHEAAVKAEKEMVIFEGKGHNDPAPVKWFVKSGAFYDRLEEQTLAPEPGASALAGRSPMCSRSTVHRQCSLPAARPRLQPLALKYVEPALLDRFAGRCQQPLVVGQVVRRNENRAEHFVGNE